MFREKMRNSINKYLTLTGRSINLVNLNDHERKSLGKVLQHYRKMPEWTSFSAWWMKQLRDSNIASDSALYAICDDLEARLGIAQGKASPPDYRDYLATLIEERYGSRYRFCKETGIDQGQLSRIFAGKGNFSLETLTRILALLHASLVIQSDEKVNQLASPEQAAGVLEAIVR